MRVFRLVLVVVAMVIAVAPAASASGGSRLDTPGQTEFLGDLMGAVVDVGMDRTSSSYPWPIDEPLVASLPADAVLAGGDWEITVGEVRRGIYPKCQWGCLINANVLRREDVTLIDATHPGRRRSHPLRQLRR